MNPTDLGPGSRLGRWRIVELLGRGGMAVVYMAVDDAAPASGPVAIKVMARSLGTDPRFLERFKREAELAARVSHPAITKVIEAGEDRGSAYLVLELVQGGSLRDRIKTEGALPWRTVATLGAAVARGLAAIHAAGLVHRDVKPDNILLDAAGRPKLTDFGLARTTLTGNSLTRTGEMLGTYEYMAPEQADNARAADAFADLYSFGATLYALVAGRVPFSGSGLSLVAKHVREIPTSPRADAPDMPVALEALILRLLAKEPRERGAGASEVARELDAIARGGGGGNGVKLGVAAAILLCLAGIVGVRVLTRPGKTVEVAPVVTAPPVEHPPARVELWDRKELAPELTGHKGAVIAVAVATGSDARVASIGADDTLRVSTPDAKLIREVAVAHPLSLGFAPDGKGLAVGCEDRRVRLFGPETTGDARELIGSLLEDAKDESGAAELPRAVCVTRDGKTVVFGGPVASIRMILEEQHSIVLRKTECTSIVPVGRTEVLTAGELGVIRIDAGVPPEELTGRDPGKLLFAKGVTRIAVSRDESTAVAGASGQALAVLDLVTKVPESRRLGAPVGDLTALAMGPKGRFVLCATRDGKIRLLDATKGDQVGEVDRGAADAALALAVSPDGRWFVAGTLTGRLVRYALPEERAR